MRLTFDHVCSVIAAVRCLNSGQSFAQIARSAKRSPSTVRRWVNRAGFRRNHHNGLYQQLYYP